MLTDEKQYKTTKKAKLTLWHAGIVQQIAM